MNDEPKNKASYEIGWGKPPRHTRFRMAIPQIPKGDPAQLET